MATASPTEGMTGTSGASRRNKLMLAARALVVVIIFAVIFRSVNVTDIASRLTPATAAAFAAGVLLLLVQTGVCTARWRLLVASGSPRPGFVDSYRAFLEGTFFNQVLPSTVGGDTWRALRWRSAAVRLSVAAASVLMDRLSGAMAAGILAVLASVVLWRYGMDPQRTLAVLLLGVLAIGAIAVFVVVVRWRGLPFRAFPRIQAMIAQIRGSLVVDGRYVLSLVYSVAGHAISGLMVYLLALSLGVGVSVILILSVTAAVLLIMMVPVSLAGWGVREASFIALFAPFGVSSQEALLIGILFGLMNVVCGLLGGLSFLADRRTVYRKGEEAARSS